MEELLLIGGSNVDYIGTPKEKLNRSTSNIGEINISFGGVMRNICENLARLGNKLIFMSAIGSDVYGKMLKRELEDLGVKIISPISNEATSSYLAINNHENNLDVAICESKIILEINKGFLAQYSSIIKEHQYIILDGNLEEEFIDALFLAYPDKKYIVDGITPQKVLRFQKHLKDIYLLKCNIYEAKALMNFDLSEKDLVNGLLVKGVKNVVLSHGSKDIYYGNNLNDIGRVKVNEIKDFVNTTGCGDALLSGIVNQIIKGKSLKEAIEFGTKLSEVTLFSKAATSIEVEKFRN